MTTDFAIVDPDKTVPKTIAAKHDPHKTLPPGKVTYAELMEKLDAVIANAVMPDFAEELIAQLDDPSGWTPMNYLKLPLIENVR